MDTPNCTYLIFAHKNPDQLKRLVERLQSDYCNFLISIDKSVDSTNFERAVSNFSNVSFVQERYISQWGSYSFIKSNLAGIRQWLIMNPETHRIVLLSAQDYPLVSNDVLNKFWLDHPKMNFLSYYSLEQPHLQQHLSRYNRYYFFLTKRLVLKYPSDGHTLLNRIKDNILKASGQFPLPHLNPLRYTLYFGSNWVRLTRKTCLYLIDFCKKNPAMEKYFSYALCPDETFYQTILVNAPAELIDPINNTNYTYTHWNRPIEKYSHPLVESDFEELMQSELLFARKFEFPASLPLMNRIDQSI
ncbi:beta-1,6-N-acetylglucosaminyltransferase [Siphonobacter sp. SORGH_AS_0500]|uniref:beta-1,6-N-acetylglucosaminyltransferase n=1 Tax=Siphonobacter sp. SORGH_AS_0500 TaxID=1864824 RepID=UPI0028575C90|nr:beta-1,6-N-acetylglucosaminyltransferase [Siphonobacter sp. SORGH_AS_0500]MDR6197150.1 hypothetical protein [Siphonobacter sp. SORGH_AS_0500]